MKKMLLLFLCCALTAAYADDEYGSGYSDDPGVSSAIQMDQSYQSSQPSYPYQSNNTTYTRIDNMTWGTDGSHYMRSGNFVWGNNGVHCYTVGNQTHCSHN